MSKKYNAFISYRHKPLDLEVAARLHRYLENFNFIKRRRNNDESIRRIFRDKDELPTSLDLKNSIYEALSESEYLIVLCSQYTKESLYVREEIEYFLNISNVKNIIVVRIQGDLQDTLPEPLRKYYNTDTADENLTEMFHIVDICGHTEQDTLKLLKTEYLQIVSILIHMPESMIAAKHYRIRLIGVVALYVMFIGLFLLFRGIYSDKFTRADAVNDELNNVQADIAQIQQNINIQRENAIYWSAEANTDMITCLQFQPGCKDTIIEILEQNIDVLNRSAQEDDTGTITEELVTAYCECERMYLITGNYDKAIPLIDKSLKLWDIIEAKYPSMQSEGKKSFFDSIYHGIVKNMESDEVIANEADLLSTKAEQLRISAIMYGKMNKIETEYQFCLDAYDTIERAIKLDSKAHLISEKAYICELVGNVLEYLGRYEEARDYLVQACDCYQQCYNEGQDESYNLYLVQDLAQLAGCCYYLNDTTVGDEKINKAIELVNNLQDYEDDQWNNVSLGAAYSGIERIYLQRQQYRKAIEYGIKAIKLFQSTYKDMNDDDAISTLLESNLMLSECYLNICDYDNYMKYSKQAFGLLNSSNEELANNSLETYFFDYYRQRTLYFIYQNDIDEAQDTIRIAKEYSNLPGQKALYYLTCNIISMCSHKPEEAQNDCLKAQKAMESMTDIADFLYSDEVRAQNSIFKAYQAIACTYNGNSELAVSLAKEAYSQAYEEQKSLCTVALLFAYQQEGDTQKAAELLKTSGNMIVQGVWMVTYAPVKTCTDKTVAEVVAEMEQGLSSYQKGG